MDENLCCRKPAHLFVLKMSSIFSSPCTPTSSHEVQTDWLALSQCTEVVIRSDSSAGRGKASRLGVGRRSKRLNAKSLFAQHTIKNGLVMLETVHTKVYTADIGTKQLDAPTMRKLIGLLGVRLLTLDGAEATRCEGTQHAQTGDWLLFVWAAVVTATIILVTAWHATCAENQTDTENQLNDGSVKYETQSTAGGIGDVWVSGAGEMFYVSRSCNELSHAVRVHRKTACECSVKDHCAGNGPLLRRA